MQEIVQLIEWGMACVVILGGVIVVSTRSTSGLRDLAAMIVAILKAIGALFARRPAAE